MYTLNRTVLLLITAYLVANLLLPTTLSLPDDCRPFRCGNCCTHDSIACCDLGGFCGVFPSHKFCANRSPTTLASGNVEETLVEAQQQEEDQQEDLVKDGVTNDPQDEDGTAVQNIFSHLQRIANTQPRLCLLNCNRYSSTDSSDNTHQHNPICSCGRSVFVTHKVNIITNFNRRCACLGDMYKMNDRSRAITQVQSALQNCAANPSCECISKDKVPHIFQQHTISSILRSAGVKKKIKCGDMVRIRSSTNLYLTFSFGCRHGFFQGCARFLPRNGLPQQLWRVSCVGKANGAKLKWNDAVGFRSFFGTFLVADHWVLNANRPWFHSLETFHLKQPGSFNSNKVVETLESFGINTHFKRYVSSEPHIAARAFRTNFDASSALFRLEM